MKNKNLVGSSNRVVRFTSKIEEQEAYAEAGMHARLVSATLDAQMNLVVYVFDYSEFDALNQALESHDYFDKDGKPTLTAREAGHYSSRETCYCYPEEETPFELVDPAHQKFAQEFAQSGSTNYMEWLEQALIAARGAG